jgi:hypothetical protein
MRLSAESRYAPFAGASKGIVSISPAVAPKAFGATLGDSPNIFLSFFSAYWTRLRNRARLSWKLPFARCVSAIPGWIDYVDCGYQIMGM